MELKTEDLILRPPKKEDLEWLEAFLERNEQHLLPWENSPEISPSAQLEAWIQDMEEGRSIRFFLFHNGHAGLIGMINFTQIFRGAFQACYLGYKIDQAFEGKGYMHQGAKAAIAYLFEKEKIHRIMSNFMPHNKRSASVLFRLGFTIEGYAKNYLKINGKWQDHILTALSYEKWSSEDSPDVKRDIKEISEKLHQWMNR